VACGWKSIFDLLLSKDECDVWMKIVVSFQDFNINWDKIIPLSNECGMWMKKHIAFSCLEDECDVWMKIVVSFSRY